MVIDLVSFGLGALVMALVAAAAVGGVVVAVRLLSGRAIIELRDDEPSDAPKEELAYVPPRIMPRSYPFSRN